MDIISRLVGIKQPAAVKSKLKATVCSAPAQLAGIELEIENVGDLDRAVALCDQNVWTVTDDGSLRPAGRSWEYVSKPMTMEYLLSELDRFFQNSHFNEANYSDRTSVHVHTNVLDLTPKQLATLCLVYSVTEDILFHFVNFYNKGERESFYRDTNIYCIPWTQCRMNHEFVRSLFKDTRNAVRHWQKYTALNLLPVRDKGSVEWRHMHGTNDMEKLTKWLNLIGCLLEFAKNSDFDEATKVINSLNDTSAYQQFFTRIFGQYLEYDDDYARHMSSGVINAKFAMMNKDKKEPTLDDLAQRIFEERAQAQLRPVDPFPLNAEIRRDRVVRNAQIQAGQAAIADAGLRWDAPPPAGLNANNLWIEEGFARHPDDPFARPLNPNQRNEGNNR